MFDRISKLFKSSAVVAALLLSGCGGGSPATANGGTITINPAKLNVSVSGINSGTGNCNGAEMTYTAFVISVFNANGIPVADAPLSVTLDWGNGTQLGGIYTPCMYLYDDPTWLGGSSTPPTSAPVGNRYTTSTGSDGTITLIVGTDLTTTYTGNLNAYSGALYAQSVLTITSN